MLCLTVRNMQRIRSFLCRSCLVIKKGAFTGALTDKPGLVELADEGILFLDEIHRLPADGQEMLFFAYG